jgi:hypothetical protein
MGPRYFQFNRSVDDHSGTPGDWPRCSKKGGAVPVK